MKKYWHVINIGIQNTLVYRVNFLFRSVFSLIPLFATISFGGPSSPEGEVAGYTLAQMTSYYLVATIVDALTAVNEDDWQIAADIKDGNISQFLLKPIDYLTYRLCLFGAGRLVFTTCAFLPVGIFIALRAVLFVLPPDAATLAGSRFAGADGIAAILHLLHHGPAGLLGAGSLHVHLYPVCLRYIAGGHLFPLDILPPALLKALHFTPFPYQLFFRSTSTWGESPALSSITACSSRPAGSLPPTCWLAASGTGAFASTSAVGG